MPPPTTDERIPEMHRYVLGLFRRVPDRVAISEEESARIEAAHLAHLARLKHSGDLVVWGAIEEESDLRGMLIFRDGPIERVRALAEADPAVQHRRLLIELFTCEAQAGLRIGPPPRPEPDDEP
ncbi:MAG: hypothetical protein L3K06_03515 [Thermoplasmata archaeon]|nr:hypothetical protein [Thermoplasmata archaeon]